MAPLDVLSGLLAAVVLLLSALAQIALWQQKEYRLDRFSAHLREPQGNLARYPFVLTAMGAILIGWLAFLGNALTLAEIAGWLGLLLFAVHHFWRSARRGIFRPDFTLKAGLAITITLLILSLHVWITFVTSLLISLQWATAAFFLPAFAALAVAAANIPSTLLKRNVIRQAARLRSARPLVHVVGITGSYGKTSTKHFLEYIVRQAGKAVAATHAHHNTPIGVARDMLRQLKPNIEVFIAEMGAYKVGEIRQLAAIAQPRIAVLTAIGNQHLNVFGSVENILSAKWELVESLPKEGTVIINADDPRLLSAAQKLEHQVLRYSLTRKADTWVEHVNFQPTHITCTLHIGSVAQGVTLPLASEALLGSTLAAATAALALNIPPEKIISALTSLKPFPRTMEVRAGKSGAVVVDDSYSGNEAGTLIAIRHLSRFPQADRRVVLLPLIELGPDAARVHRKIGEAVRASRASLYVLGNSYKAELGAGIYETDPRRLAKAISTNLTPETVILLENRLPDVVRNAVLA